MGSGLTGSRSSAMAGLGFSYAEPSNFTIRKSVRLLVSQSIMYVRVYAARLPNDLSIT
jgi:hypothetical protein